MRPIDADELIMRFTEYVSTSEHYLGQDLACVELPIYVVRNMIREQQTLIDAKAKMLEKIIVAIDAWLDDDDDVDQRILKARIAAIVEGTT